MTEEDKTWLREAEKAFSASSNYINSEIRTDWARDVAHFGNEHAHDSKFNSPAYQNRHKVFRPKTRMAGRSAEASLAAALFSTSDLLDVRAIDESSAERAAGAEAQKALLQYRLENTIPWFLTAVGARQDCFVYGICATFQHWQFEEHEEEEPAADEAGNLMMDVEGNPVMAQKRTTVLDRPWIDMIPPENLRFDPECDWRDPVKSSAYLIWIQPMYLEDVMAKMGQGEWIEHAPETVKGTIGDRATDTTRRQREEGRPDQQISMLVNPICYVHQNFIRKKGREYVFWTLGTELLLSKPRLLKEVYPIGERPIVIGRSVVETHKSYPSSDAKLSSGLQVATNEIANQRLDNVALVLNKRYIIKRGKQIDVQSLMRNVPGGGIVADDPQGDIRIMDTPDVTASSYQEQDRLDVQIDEMQGVFSGSSVQSNRTLGETVGGMNLMGSSASAINEYVTRVFVETWVEPVLRQLIKLEAAYETDETVLAVAGQKSAEALQRIGKDRITDEMLMADVLLRVNVGVGSTNPQQKIERLMTGLNSVSQIPSIVDRINPEEVVKEVFGALGYKNGERFIGPPAEQPQPPPDPMIDVKMKELELRGRELDLKFQEADNAQERMQAELSLKRELGFAEIAGKYQISAEKLSADMRKFGMKIRTDRDIKALVETNKMNEMQLKRSVGSGI